MNLFSLEVSLLVTLMCAHVYLCPFTKVEESFNIQATYDLLYKSWRQVSSFDHIEFPGVVPRTFIGPLILAAVSAIPKAVFDPSPFAMLHLLRIVLGLLTVMSLLAIRSALVSRYSPVTGLFFTLIIATQFHTLFYASRTLPNTFALILSNFAFADLLRTSPRRRPYRSIAILSVACALFRSELCLYIFTTLLTELTLQNIALRKVVFIGLTAAVGSAVTSIVVDSYFWNRTCYPELEVFYFNVVLNKSSAWGTSPFHWYFTNALPRALGGSYGLAIFATLANRNTLVPVMLPVVSFVAIYSVLPHKELRFIFYALPIFSVAAAIAVDLGYNAFKAQFGYGFVKKNEDNAKQDSKVTRPRTMWKSVIRNVLLWLLTAATLGGGILQLIVSTVASRANYASGLAMRNMHSSEVKTYIDNGRCKSIDTRRAVVHIDVHSAMNGISQFVQEKPQASTCPKWFYSKREDIDNIHWGDFTHLLSEKEFVPGFCVTHIQYGYAGVDLRRGRLRMAPHTFVHRNMNVSQAGCL